MSKQERNKTTMTAKELADAIVAVVERETDATHGTLIREFGDLAEGDQELFMDPPNVCIAGRATLLLGDALNILRAEKPARVEMEVAEELVAMVDAVPMPKYMPWLDTLPPEGESLGETHFAPFRLVLTPEYDAAHPPVVTRYKPRPPRTGPHPLIAELEKNIMQGLRDSVKRT